MKNKQKKDKPLPQVVLILSSTQNFVESSSSKKRSENETNAKLVKVANVNRETYRQAKRVLDLGNDNLKQRVLSGETSISAGYKKLA